MNKKILNSKFCEEIGLLQLINRHFWKSKIGPISAIILSLFFMISYKILNDGNEDIYPNGLSSYISFSILPLTLITLPQLILDFKCSIILRKISISRITPLFFMLLVIFYYFIIAIVSSLLVVSCFAILSWNDVRYYFSKINWGYFSYALLNIFITSLTLGFLLGTIIKSSNLVQIIGIIAIIISMALVGQILPPTITYKINALRYISLVSPLTYPLSLMNNVTMVFSNWPDYIPTSIFDFNNQFYITYFWSPTTKILVCDIFQKYLNVIMPYLLTIIFSFASIKLFKWTSR